MRVIWGRRVGGHVVENGDPGKREAQVFKHRRAIRSGEQSAYTYTERCTLEQFSFLPTHSYGLYDALRRESRTCALDSASHPALYRRVSSLLNSILLDSTRAPGQPCWTSVRTTYQTTLRETGSLRRTPQGAVPSAPRPLHRSLPFRVHAP